MSSASAQKPNTQRDKVLIYEDIAMTTKTQTDVVANIVRETLVQRFKDEFVFDPIIVEPKIDHDGNKYLNITIVFDGDQNVWTQNGSLV